MCAVSAVSKFSSMSPLYPVVPSCVSEQTSLTERVSSTRVRTGEAVVGSYSRLRTSPTSPAPPCSDDDSLAGDADWIFALGRDYHAAYPRLSPNGKHLLDGLGALNASVSVLTVLTKRPISVSQLGAKQGRWHDSYSVSPSVRLPARRHYYCIK